MTRREAPPTAWPPGDPLWQREPLELAFSGGVLGLGITVRTNSAPMAALARAAFGRFAQPESDRPAVTLDVVAHPEWPAAREDLARAPGGVDLVHRERGPLYAAGDGRGSLVVADLERGQASAFVDRWTPPAIARSVLLQSPVWRIAAWRGLVALHAAAVAVDGVTLVLRGDGGAGKSTLALAAARAGHRVLSEEVTWWDPLGPSPVVRGAPWTVHLEPGGARLFPDLAGRIARPAGGDGSKLAVELPALGLGDRCVERLAPGPVVFVAWSPAATRWAGLDGESARRRFDASLSAAERTQSAARLDEAREALCADGAFSLEQHAPDAAVRALEVIAARCGGA